MSDKLQRSTSEHSAKANWQTKLPVAGLQRLLWMRDSEWTGFNPRPECSLLWRGWWRGRRVGHHPGSADYGSTSDGGGGGAPTNGVAPAYGGRSKTGGGGGGGGGVPGAVGK